MHLKAMLETAAGRFGGRTAVALGGRRLSYAGLDKASNKIANALMAMGITRGDRVAMLLANSPEFVVVYFGIVKMGAIAVPLDTKYKTGELSCLFDDCRPRVLVTESPYLEPIRPLLPCFSYIEKVIDVSPEPSPQFLSYRQIMAEASAQPVKAELKDDDVAQIAYTSGPTLRPRGVMLIHKNLVMNAAITATAFQQTEKDVVMLFALALHHAFGMVIVMLASIGKGSTVIMQAGRSMSGLMETIERERVTIFMGVPFVHALLLREIEAEGLKYDISSLRICGSAGSPLDEGIMERFQRYLGKGLIQLYGLTEATALVTCQPIDGSGKIGSVGKAVPPFKIKIVDEDGSELEPGQPGEVMVKGLLMKGYYNKPRATAEAVSNGWLHTGDIGHINEDGELFFLGLKKPMLITKGQNIYFSDVEDVLSAHDKVAEAAAVGIADPDGMRGEVVRAVIRLKSGQTATAAEMKRFCLERMANYKVPKQVVFVDSLPKDADGSINRHDLKGDLGAISAACNVAGRA